MSKLLRETRSSLGCACPTPGRLRRRPGAPGTVPRISSNRQGTLGFFSSRLLPLRCPRPRAESPGSWPRRGRTPTPPRCGKGAGFGNRGFLGATANGLPAILSAAKRERALAQLRHRITALPHALLSENDRSPRTSVLEQRLSGVAFGGRTVCLPSCLEEVHAVDAALAVHPGLEDGKARQQVQHP